MNWKSTTTVASAACVNPLPTVEPEIPAPMIENIEVPKPVYSWATKAEARHSCRTIMDEYNVPWGDKRLLCSIIERESNFDPKAVGKVNKNGTQDFGLLQYNNGKNKQGVPYWIGEGADFKDVDEVLNNPEKNVRIFIREFKKGNLKYWSSFVSGAYKNTREWSIA